MAGNTVANPPRHALLSRRRGVGGASAVQGHQSQYATVTKDCINSITGQDEEKATPELARPPADETPPPSSS